MRLVFKQQELCFCFWLMVLWRCEAALCTRSCPVVKLSLSEYWCKIATAHKSDDENGDFNNINVKTSTRSLLGFAVMLPLLKVWRDYYSKMLFIVSNSGIFGSHLHCVMEAPRNEQRIGSIRRLGDGCRTKLMWMK